MERNLTKNTLDPSRLPPLLTVKEYCRIARQEEPTVRYQLRAGRLKGVKVGSLWKVCRCEVERILEAGA